MHYSRHQSKVQYIFFYSQNTSTQRSAPPPPPPAPNVTRQPTQSPHTKPRANPPGRPPPITNHMLQVIASNSFDKNMFNMLTMNRIHTLLSATYGGYGCRRIRSSSSATTTTTSTASCIDSSHSCAN